MKALVYHGPGKRAWEDKPKPRLQAATDAIGKIARTTICGTDLHILKGDVATVTDGRILGTRAGRRGRGRPRRLHLQVGRPGPHLVHQLVREVFLLQEGHVLHCESGGGWILGNTIDGTQAEYVRIRSPTRASTSSRRASTRARSNTGFECGVLNGAVKPGDVIAVVGAGPVGLAALLTAQFYSPAESIMVDLDDNRLEVSRGFGATQVVNSEDGKAVERVMALTVEGRRRRDRGGRDPATFDICQEIVTAGGHLANVGVHGKSVALKLEKLWAHNVTITTPARGHVTTPMPSGPSWPGGSSRASSSRTSSSSTS